MKAVSDSLNLISAFSNAKLAATVTRQTHNVLIIGGLQTGKTSLFTRLCSKGSNDYDAPHSSFTLKRGVMQDRAPLQSFVDAVGLDDHHEDIVLIDTPGTTTLFPQGQDEQLVRDALVDIPVSALLVVANAKSLTRTLAIVAHAAELEFPMVLAVNMADEAHARGIRIDCERLSELLGIDVVATRSTYKDREGLAELRKALRSPRVPNRIAVLPTPLRNLLDELTAELGELPRARGLALWLATGDDKARRLVDERLGAAASKRAELLAKRIAVQTHLPVELSLTESFHKAASELSAQVVAREKPRRRPWLDALGSLAYHPVWGVAMALCVTAVVYLWIGDLGATRVVGFFENQVFGEIVLPLFSSALDGVPWPLVRDVFIDPDFGLVSTGLFLAFGLVMPVLLFYYFAFNLMMESGYLPRLSVLLDRLFRFIGLNGKGIVPLAMGFSCITMALITTRMLQTKKERFIASFLLILGMPCAPLLSVMLVILAQMPITASIAVFGVIITQTVLAGVLANKFVPGYVPDFILEIPPMRVPKLPHVFRQTIRQTYAFMKEAVPFFLSASLALFFIERAGGLRLFEGVGRPLVSDALGLPSETVQVFIMTLIRRESGAAELEHIRDAYTNLQIVVTLVVMTFLTPCVNALIVLLKERGIRQTALLVGSVSLYALAVGTALNWICRSLGVTFT